MNSSLDEEREIRGSWKKKIEERKKQILWKKEIEEREASFHSWTKKGERKSLKTEE